MENSLIMVVSGIALFIILFFLLRELFCWYWKINSIVDLLEKQNKLLDNVLKEVTKQEEKKGLKQ